MNQPLESRIQSLLDGSISEADFHHLEDELIANPEARQIYYSYVSMHQGLDYRLSRSGSLTSVAGTHTMQGLAESRLNRQRQRARRYALFSAAALIIISLVTMRFFVIEQETRPAPLDFATAPGTLYTLTHDEGSEPPQGLVLENESRLQISQGSVELQFQSGVRAILQGPADITLHNDQQLYMDQGTAWFHVPENAKGFTVFTRELKIIDLGTKFGVLSNANKDDEVHVFQGKVKVEALHGVRKETILTTGQASQVRPYGRFLATELKTSTFPTELPQTLPHLHWSFDDQVELISHNSLTTGSDLQYQHHATSNPSFAPDLNQGRFGKAITLDGIGNYLETDWQGILGNAPRSVAFWLKLPDPSQFPPTAGTQSILAWGHQQTYYSGDIYNNSKWTIHLNSRPNASPVLHASFGGYWYYYPESELTGDTWHHVAIIYSGQWDQDGNPIAEFYLNGKTQAHQIGSYSPVRRDADQQVVINTMERTPLVIGANLPQPGKILSQEGNPLLKAKIDELYIIEGAISEQAVHQLMINNRLIHP